MDQPRVARQRPETVKWKDKLFLIAPVYDDASDCLVRSHNGYLIDLIAFLQPFVIGEKKFRRSQLFIFGWTNFSEGKLSCWQMELALGILIV